MAAPLIPVLHDSVRWRGAKWLVTRVLQRGRFEITVMRDPTIQWVCLAEQLSWEEKNKAWLLTALPMPTRGNVCED